MILVDTSVWIDHFRLGGPLAALLDAGAVLIHPFVIGELALGYLEPRDVTLQTLQSLPQARIATHDEILQFIEQRQLFGLGVGYVDVHLLASAMLMGQTALWTNAKTLHAVAARLAIAHVDMT